MLVTVTRACDSHRALQPVGRLMWFGKQMKQNASVLKLFQGTEGNRPQSFLTSQKDLYKNLKAMYISGEQHFSLCVSFSYIALLSYKYTEKVREEKGKEF